MHVAEVLAGHHRDDAIEIDVVLARADELAVAQHGDAVAQRRDLVEPVRDVHERARLPPADQREQARDLGVGERRGRLVEHDHAGVVGERARDLDELLHADAQRADRRLEIDRFFQYPRHHVARGCEHVRVVDDAEERRLAPEHEVVGDGHVRHQRELLVDDRDAGAARVERALEPAWLAVDDDLAVVAAG